MVNKHSKQGNIFIGLSLSLISCILPTVLTKSYNDVHYPCESRVYCKGEILHTIQQSRLYKDSKTFVDLPMKFKEEFILKSFKNLMNTTNHKPTREQLETFVEEHFSPLGSDVLEWTPSDWVESPALAERVNDLDYRTWVLQLNKLWKSLGRKIHPRVVENPDMFSILPLPYPFFVPGDRFREMFYWDSYWVLHGLLLSDMELSSKLFIHNFFYLVQKYGFVPNGARIYLTNRSQPPLLIPMVHRYYEVTRDLDFLERNLGYMENEYRFWLTERTVDVTKNGVIYAVGRYTVHLDTPRPEGYTEDLELTKDMTEDKSSELYSDIAAACESGLDFTTRWFSDLKSFRTIRTRDIIPVDLNVFLLWNEQLLEKFHLLLGNSEKATFYKQKAKERHAAINALMWNETEGVWFDYDLKRREQRTQFYPSNLFPLMVDCHGGNMDTVDRVVTYLQNVGATSYPGGIPSSLSRVIGQQWDFPNAWAPHVHLAIEALDSTKHRKAQILAKDIAQKWLRNNWLTYNKTGHMYEKYNVEEVGRSGDGGEYSVQLGFGWTNGAILMLLDKYGDSVTAHNTINSDKDSEKPNNMRVLMFFLLFSVMFICLRITTNSLSKFAQASNGQFKPDNSPKKMR